MPDTIHGLPVHPLIVHATVVTVPAAALAVLLAALWPWFRQWAGVVPVALSAVALILDPLTTASGDNLERMVGPDPLIEKHSHLADGLLPWLIGLFVVALAVTWVWWRERSARTNRAAADSLADSAAGRPRLPVMAVIGVLAVLAAVGTAQQVVRIGDSGAKAAWSDVAQSAPARHS